MEQRVFICYGREDADRAKRLYVDLRNAGLKPWLDQECLQGGQKWRTAIRQAIRQSRFFIALLSSTTVGRRGFLNAEIREALDTLREYPESDIFLIPVRLDGCEMPRDELCELQRIDLFPEWDIGVRQIVKAVAVSDRPVTAFITIQCQQLDPDLFTRVFTSPRGREYALPGYDKLHVTAQNDPLLEFLSSNKQVEEIHWVHGDFDILAVVKAPTIVAAGEILDRIRKLPGVRNTSTTVSIGRYR
jgi:DNA-binding Lrp family transcriptional regulator